VTQKNIGSKSGPVYLDYAATSPVDESVAAVMMDCLTLAGTFANPASRSHVYGWQAEEKVEAARGQVAELLQCDPREIVWTSGATESNNLALKGVFEKLNYCGHLITSVIEHKAILDPSVWLEERGVEVTRLQPDERGLITPEQLQAALRPETKLVSLMWVNNEIGIINPINELVEVCHAAGVLMHTDAAQAVGKIDIDLSSSAVDLLSLSGHKFYAPKGVGALFVRRSAQPSVTLQMHGGGQERGLRSGTLPTHQLAGIGAAAQLAKDEMQEVMPAIAKLRDRLWQGIADLPNVRRNGAEKFVSPFHLNVCFAGLDGEVLLLSLRDIAVSTGSACASASMAPSYVLTALGLSGADAHSSIRLSLGRYTTTADIDRSIAHIRDVVMKLQRL
jgi:cysteine desulfurase